uniref:Uncharacterized protein n=1 Tax=Pygocentrus nattereri TaxID=42514 RepID=A0A3B4EAP1_PYGNA
MLEHSGTYRESAMHSGTFAQEIITLVHHVKENYFQGQGITLNERFSSEQHYTLEDEDEFAEDEQELEEIKPVINRYSCLVRQVPAPGDLRHDLERKRQQRLEGVKITIAGGGFSQVAPQSQENEPTYIDEEDVHDAGVDFDWSEQMPQQTEQWVSAHTYLILILGMLCCDVHNVFYVRVITLYDVSDATGWSSWSCLEF